MLITITLVLLYVFVPVLIIYLCNRYSFLNKIGSVLLAYAVGLVLGNLGLFPEGFEETQDLLTTITIALAIPLLLFSVKIGKWMKLAGKTMISMFVALSAVLLMVFLGKYLWGDQIDESWKISGMLMGVYSGGTPNLAAIRTALDVDQTTYIITHTYDMMLSAIYLVILLSFGKTLFRMFLPKYKSIYRSESIIDNKGVEDSIDKYEGILKRKTLVPLLLALGASLLIVAISGATGMLVDNTWPDAELMMATAILLITSLGIGASFIPRINKIEKTFELGMYLILIFSMVVASMADISKFNLDSRYLLYYITLAIFGSLILHIVFSKIFKIDADTTMVCSAALICSPPFVPVVAGALKNKEVILSGLTVGIIGYAAGNYLGVMIALLLK